ncbi:MAG: tRNA-dihydrouridine synthase, partial [Arenicellales bacterium]
KVCRKAAGSALLADEKQVAAILEAVVAAVNVPVTLKIRTGITREQNNAVNIARIAEQSGIQSLAVHGRSRACLFKGEAEYDTIRAVKQSVGIPVLANGDITSPQKARAVLQATGADGVMVGRGAQGKPWLPSMIADYLVLYAAEPNIKHSLPVEPDLAQQQAACLEHIQLLYAYYGDKMGVRIARKHIRWYLMNIEGGLALSKQLNRLEAPKQILQTLADFYDQSQSNAWFNLNQSSANSLAA